MGRQLLLFIHHPIPGVSKGKRIQGSHAEIKCKMACNSLSHTPFYIGLYYVSLSRLLNLFEVCILYILCAIVSTLCLLTALCTLRTCLLTALVHLLRSSLHYGVQVIDS